MLSDAALAEKDEIFLNLIKFDNEFYFVRNNNIETMKTTQEALPLFLECSISNGQNNHGLCLRQFNFVVPGAFYNFCIKTMIIIIIIIIIIISLSSSSSNPKFG